MRKLGSMHVLPRTMCATHRPLVLHQPADSCCHARSSATAYPSAVRRLQHQLAVGDGCDPLCSAGPLSLRQASGLWGQLLRVLQGTGEEAGWSAYDVHTQLAYWRTQLSVAGPGPARRLQNTGSVVIVLNNSIPKTGPPFPTVAFLQLLPFVQCIRVLHHLAQGMLCANTPVLQHAGCLCYATGPQLVVGMTKHMSASVVGAGDEPQGRGGGGRQGSN